MNTIRRTSARLNGPIVLSEEFLSVDDDNACTAQIMAHKDIFEFVHGSKSIIDADFEDENEINNAVPVPTSSEMRNIMKTNQEPPSSCMEKVYSRLHIYHQIGDRGLQTAHMPGSRTIGTVHRIPLAINVTCSWLRKYIRSKVALLMDASRSKQCAVCMVSDCGRGAGCGYQRMRQSIAKHIVGRQKPRPMVSKPSTIPQYKSDHPCPEAVIGIINSHSHQESKHASKQQENEKKRREREEPGLEWRKGKSPALDGESMRGEAWLERTGRERERKGLSPRLEWKDDERRWR
ncbi:hypothetical protein TNCV_1780141 [Trichonephila clavipes]|nr:hypothetical protein TNCV_1780141 [Trichonephila clavipes]